VTYKQIKYLILFIPTATIGLWEYIRHTVLLPYLSMDLGNLLAPLIVFLVTITFTRRLFRILEEMQEALRQERIVKAGMEERERLAQELHDGISQSLFLLSVKLDRLESQSTADDQQEVREIRRMIRHIYEDIRQSIANLRTIPKPEVEQWRLSLEELIREFEHGTGIRVDLDWHLPEDLLTAKEKVELTACLRESLLNVRKHARGASLVRLTGKAADRGWICTVEDDGREFDEAALRSPNRFGVTMMRDRTRRMGWSFQLERKDGRTRATIRKGGEQT
jgi:two-component system nitrate/nitrite sensor histidine kinase NarQ